MVLKPDQPPDKSRLLTICAAVAVSKALQSVCGVGSRIKWVNDIFVDSKKICGILTEASLSAEMQSLDYVIIGIGINTGKIPEEIEDIATSVLEVTGKQGFRNRLVEEVLNQLEKIFLDYLLAGREADILTAYSERLIYINEKDLVKMPADTFEAVVLGID